MPQILQLQQASLGVVCVFQCDMHMKTHNNNFHVNQFSNETNFISRCPQQQVETTTARPKTTEYSQKCEIKTAN